MLCTQVNDDELWSAIANNTNALSDLIEKQVQFDAGLGAPDLDTRQELLRSNVQAIKKYHREYRAFIAEVRRRYPTI